MLGHIWFGDVNQKRSTNTFGAVWVGMYIWFITALIVFLQDAALFYVLMLQGISSLIAYDSERGALPHLVPLQTFTLHAFDGSVEEGWASMKT